MLGFLWYSYAQSHKFVRSSFRTFLEIQNINQAKCTVSKFFDADSRVYYLYLTASEGARINYLPAKIFNVGDDSFSKGLLFLF